MSVFAAQGLGVCEAGAGDLLAVPMASAGAALPLAVCRTVAIAADVLVWILACPARRSFTRE